MIAELPKGEQHSNPGRYWTAVKNYLRPGPEHLLMYLAGRFQVVRRLGVWYYQTKSHSRAVTQKGDSRLYEVDATRVVANLKEDGIYDGLRLREGTLNDLRHFAESAICYGNGDLEKTFFIKDKALAERVHGARFSVARYFNCVERCSAIRDLANDPILLAIARGYLGAEPTLIGARMWWSFAGASDLYQQARDGQAFHYDLDDYRAIAFFFYLSDVDGESGPHVCVRGSHRRKPLRFLISLFKSRSDEQIAAFYGDEKIVRICGKAGSGFTEDLFCFHKGSHATTRDRLLLQIRYRYRVYGDHSRE